MEGVVLMKNTLVVNLIGGQGSGKSTMMANLFSWLKWRNVDCEMCSEFAKELVWEERKQTFKDELYMVNNVMNYISTNFIMTLCLQELCKTTKTTRLISMFLPN